MTLAKAATGETKNILVKWEQKRSRDKHELAFLPAALEIVETPPSPIGRAISVTIIALFCLALVWASVGRVDIVASASGKIIPSGRVKLIQPFETGVQTVEAGDVLIELDPTMTAAEQEHIRSDLIAAQLDVARLRAALSNSDNPQGVFQPPANASVELVAMQRQYLATQTEEYRARIASLDRQRAQKAAERDTIAATIAKLQADEPIIRQRVDIRKALVEKELVSRITYLETLQQLTENEQDQAIQQSRLVEAKAALAAITENQNHEAAEFHSKLHGELAEAERKAAGLSRDLVRAEERTKLQLLTAPVDGVVQQLSVHTIGGVVTPAQQLAVVVPSDAVLEVEAVISNRDVGFVRAGQDVQIKVDTFNFTRYGLVHGRVLNVSQDAIARDAASDKRGVNRADADATSEPKGQELNYAAHISLDHTTIQVNDGIANLSPGMAVTAEINTGSQSILSYLLSPLLRYRQEALRER